MLTDQFILPKDKVYLCGHSLGPCFKYSKELVEKTLDDYSQKVVEAWNTSSWVDLPYTVGDKIARFLGVGPDKVVVGDSTSLNLYKVLKISKTLQQKRHEVVTSLDNFPADIYIAQGLFNVKKYPRELLCHHINKKTAVVLISHVSYQDSYVFDMKSIIEKAKSVGALVCIDVSHSIGIVPCHDLGDIDFIVGCTYKYLSGGPGSPSFVYVNPRHYSNLMSPIQGWMGHDYPFLLSDNYSSTGIRKLMVGTPSILSLKSLEGALKMITPDLVIKSFAKALINGSYLIARLECLGMKVSDPVKRGGHVSFRHENGYAISRALIHHGFVCDFRAPDWVRICINPLYVCLDDLNALMDCLGFILDEKVYLSWRHQALKKVT